MAVVELVVSGMLAARWSSTTTRWDSAKTGALAGGIAGTMAFAALGAAAAGTLGLGRTLLHSTGGGMADTIIRTTNFTYATLWAMLLGGAALGALGGVLSPPSANGEKRQDESAILIAEVLSNRLLLVSLLILVESVATTPILRGSENANQQDSMIVLFNEATASSFIVYLTVLMWILRLARNRLTPDAPVFRKRKVNSGLWFVLLLSMLAWIVMVIILLPGSDSSQRFESRLLVNPIFLAGTLASIALNGYVLKVAVNLSKELRAAGGMTQAETAQSKTELHSFTKRENIPLVALFGGVTFALPMLTLVPLVINLARGVIPAAAGTIKADIVRDVFCSQAWAAYGVFLLGAVTILCSISIASGLSRFRERTH